MNNRKTEINPGAPKG